LVKNVESNMPAFQAGIQGSLHSESLLTSMTLLKLC
jgi:hypothetical protein